MRITHPKIAGLIPSADGPLPQWAPYAGWTLILEGGGNWAPFASGPDTARALGQVAGVLRDFGAGRLLANLSLCLLPPETYHVTFCDLIHQGQIARIPPEGRAAFAAAIAAAQMPAFLRPVLADWPAPDIPLRLRIGGMARLSPPGRAPSVLALALQPQAPETGPWPALAVWRDAVQARLEAATGEPGAGTGLPPRPWQPHLSLGYFADPDQAAANPALLAALEERLCSALDGLVLTWQAVGLYRFASMAEYRAVAR